jgi:hypothetical protein
MIEMTWTGWDGSVWDLRTGQVRLTNDGVEGLSNLDFTIYTQDTALRDGQFMTGWKAAPRDVIMPVMLGPVESDLEWLTLERAWFKTMHPAKPGTLSITAPDGSARGPTLRFLDDGGKAYETDPSKRRMNVYAMRMVADDPWFIGPSFGRKFQAPKQTTDFYGGGAVGPRYSWTGEPNASTSTKFNPDNSVNINYIANPSAEGTTLGISPSTNGSLSIVDANLGTGTGTKAYRLVQTTPDIVREFWAASPTATRPAAKQGEAWHLRYRIKPTETSYGAKRVVTQLRAVTSTGAIVGSSGSYAVTTDLIPAGVFTRWVGVANNSVSERYEGTTKRRNLVGDPDTTALTRWAIPSATTALANGRIRITPTGASTSYIYPLVDADTTNGGGRFAAASNARITMRAQVWNTGTATTWVRAGVAYYLANGAGSTNAFSSLGPFVKLEPGEGARVEHITTMSADEATTGFLPLVYVYPTATGGVALAANQVETTGWTVETGPTSNASGTLDHFSGATVNTGSGIADAQDIALTMSPAPAGVAFVQAFIGTATSYRDNPNDGYYIDNVMLTQADGPAPDYFDGNSVSKVGATPFYIMPSNRTDTAAISNPGDIPVWPTYTLEGPIDAFQIRQGTGLIAGNFPIVAGTTLTIETSPTRQIALLWKPNGTVENVTRKLSSFGFRQIPPGESIRLDTNITGTGTFNVDGAPHYFRGW